MSFKALAPEAIMHNRYDIKLVDSRTGETKQEVTGYNVADNLTYLKRSLVGTSGTWHVTIGSAEEIEAETAWDQISYTPVYMSPVATFTRVSPVSFTKVAFQSTASFPATTSFTGTFTGVGFGYSNSSSIGNTSTSTSAHSYVTPVSKALLVDAENNPISINKTSFDILTVTVTLYFTTQLKQSAIASIYNFKYMPPIGNAYAGKIQFPNLSISGLPLLIHNLPVIYSQQYIDKDSQYVSTKTWPQTPAKYEIAYALQAGILNKYDISQLLAFFTNQRIEQAYTYTGFAHNLTIVGIGAIPLPNERILPAYWYKQIQIGVGNNTATSFFTEVNETINTIVHVNGEVTQHTFVNFDITKSPLWNKVLRVDWYADIDSDDVVHSEYVYSGANVDTTDTLIEDTSIAWCRLLLSDKSICNIYAEKRWPATTNQPELNVGEGARSVAPGLASAIIYYDQNGITLDHIRVGKGMTSFGPSYYNYTYSFTLPTYQLDYSMDGVTWTTAYKVTTTYNAYSTQYFDSITAPYWRIRNYTATQANEYYANSYYVGYSYHDTYDLTSATAVNETAGIRSYDPKWFVVGDSSQHDFGKVGVNFDTPPAEGAVITMDAQLNLPYKDSNVVFETSCQLAFSDPDAATISTKEADE